MKAIFVGGPLEGNEADVNPSTARVLMDDKDHMSYVYERTLGTSFGVGPLGQRENEEAFFVDRALLIQGLAQVIDYVQATGL